MSHTRHDATATAPADEDVDDKDLVLSNGTKFPATGAKRTVGICQMLFIVFFAVSGGPYGLEDAVSAGGPGWTLVVIFSLPLIWNLPMGLLTAELASALPTNGGYIIWVSHALGNFWGFQEGYWSWVSNVVDNALYPSLVVSYFQVLVGWNNANGLYLFLARVCLCGIVAAMNIVGLQLVGSVSVLLAIITLLPFVLMVCIKLPEISLGDSFDFEPVHSVSWGVLMSGVLWNNVGWDSSGTVAGQVINPKRTYLWGISAAVLLVLFVNTLPVIVAASTRHDYSDWTNSNSFWASLAYDIDGSWMRYMVVISAMVSNGGIFIVCLTTSSWALFAIALPGLLDAPILTKLHAKYKTPYASIICNTLCIMACSALPFVSLLQIDVVFNAFSQVLEVFALVTLRVKEPDMPRPYKIPLGTVSLAFFTAPICIVSVFTAINIPNFEKLLVVVVMFLGGVLYYVRRFGCIGVLTAVFCCRTPVEDEHQTVDIVDVFQTLDEIEEALIEESTAEVTPLIGPMEIAAAEASPAMHVLRSPGILSADRPVSPPALKLPASVPNAHAAYATSGHDPLVYVNQPEPHTEIDIVPLRMTHRASSAPAISFLQGLDDDDAVLERREEVLDNLSEYVRANTIEEEAHQPLQPGSGADSAGYGATM